MGKSAAISSVLEPGFRSPFPFDFTLWTSENLDFGIERFTAVSLVMGLFWNELWLNVRCYKIKYKIFGVARLG